MKRFVLVVVMIAAASPALASTMILQAMTLKDGRTDLIFTLTDSASVLHGPFVEIRPAGENETNFLATYEAAFDAAQTQAEIASNISSVETIGSLATPTFQYSTVAANVAALRAAYAVATQLQAVMMGDYLNSLTDAQLEAAFGLTATQVTTLRTNKLGPAATLAASIRASAGQ